MMSNDISNDIIISLELPQLRVLGQSRQPGLIAVQVIHRRDYASCPRCRYRTRNIHDRRWQKKLDIPLHRQVLVLVLCKRRFHCPQCHKVFTEPDDVCGWRRRTTERLRYEMYQQACHQTVKRVAEVHGVGQRFVRESFASYASRDIAAVAPVGYTPRVLGIDEFSVRKGHRYQTLFGAPELRRRLEVVDGRDRESAQGYLNKLAEPEKVKVVVIDLSEVYRGAVEMCLPEAEIVADKMHVTGLLNRALDKVRLRKQRVKGEERRGSLYAGRHLLLRKIEDLNEGDKAKLRELLRGDAELKRTWQLKEDFRRWYREADVRGARLELKAWEREVAEGGPKEYREILPTIKRWREQILNFFTYRVTNGYMEGSNNRTKAIQRQAYGYRNTRNLRLRILLPKVA